MAQALRQTIDRALGILALFALLSIATAVPVVHFIALGYMLEAEGRAARSGLMRDAFPLINVAPRLGAILVGVWVWLLPLRLLGSLAADAHVLHPGSHADLGLHRAAVLAAALVTVHLCLALAAGGTLGCFFRPVRNVTRIRQRIAAGGWWTWMEGGILDFLDALSLRYHFWLGLRGAAGAFAWLLVPSVLFSAADKPEGPAVLITLVGALLLMLVTSWVGFLQARFAAQNRLGAFRDLGAVRSLFARAPLEWVAAVLMTLAPALPLYVFRVVLPPDDAVWLITPAFVAGVWPGKLLTGWAYGRAARRDGPVWWPVRLLARLLLVPILAGYVFALFFTQFIGAHGKGVLFEHHAFLLRIGL